MKKLSVIGLFALVLMLSGCFYHMNYVYPNSSLYLVGDQTFDISQVDKIMIDWISGDVEVQGLETATNIAVSEIIDADTEDLYRMHYYLADEVLFIRFAASMSNFNHTFVTKKLIVALPTTFDSPIEINVVSSNIEISDIKSELMIDSVSGNIDIDRVASLNCEINQVSGAINFVEPAITYLNIDTVSGRVKADQGGFANIIINAVSSQIELDIVTPLQCSIETVSGQIILTFPSNSTFRFEYKKLAGKLNSEFPLIINNDIYTVSAGGDLFHFETVSGNLTLKIAE
ncbi:MAG: DUF4097 family beta strand repeat-containing protein [Bacilli bacterium]